MKVVAKDDLRTIEIAHRLREETVMTVKCIAERAWDAQCALCPPPIVVEAQGKLGWQKE